MQLTNEASESLAGVLEQLVRVMRQVATTGDLSFAAAVVLGRLMREGPQRLTDLAVRESVSQPGMTQLVTRLERDRLVRRKPSPDDGRVVVVHLTPTGRDVVARRRAERAAVIDRLLAQLSTKDRAAINAALPALRRLSALSSVPGNSAAGDSAAGDSAAGDSAAGDSVAADRAGRTRRTFGADQ